MAANSGMSQENSPLFFTFYLLFIYLFKDTTHFYQEIIRIKHTQVLTMQQSGTLPWNYFSPTPFLSLSRITIGETFNSAEFLLFSCRQ